MEQDALRLKLITHLLIMSDEELLKIKPLIEGLRRFSNTQEYEALSELLLEDAQEPLPRNDTAFFQANSQTNQELLEAIENVNERKNLITFTVEELNDLIKKGNLSGNSL